VANRRLPVEASPTDSTDVMALGLPVPIANALDNEGIRTLGILRRVSDGALSLIVGRGSIEAVREAVPCRRDEGEPEVGRPPGDMSHADWRDLP